VIKVGCCGYPTSAKKYHENFCVVELNKTFYQYPRISTVVGWRKKAPKDFEFTVKAHQDVSHKFRLKGENSISTFNKMKQICKMLEARVLLIQTPGSFRADKMEDVYEFFGRVDRENLVLVWESRGSSWEETDVRERLSEFLYEVDVTHVTDPFRLMPAYAGDVVYFRLHGLGERMYYYQYTDAELVKLYELVKPFESGGKEVYVFFNNLSMLEDGLRFMAYLEYGEFPSLTGVVGLESVRRVVEKARFPMVKSVLLKRLGWRVVELEDGQQVRLKNLLRDMPSKAYGSVEEVLREMML